jgi:hypothetical protein
MSTGYAGMLFPGSHAPAASEPATLQSVDLNEASLTSGLPTVLLLKNFLKPTLPLGTVRDIKLANVLSPLDGCENKNIRDVQVFML